jgi:hypothetical protein
MKHDGDIIPRSFQVELDEIEVLVDRPREGRDCIFDFFYLVPPMPGQEDFLASIFGNDASPAEDGNREMDLVAVRELRVSIV